MARALEYTLITRTSKRFRWTKGKNVHVRVLEYASTRQTRHGPVFGSAGNRILRPVVFWNRKQAWCFEGKRALGWTTRGELSSPQHVHTRVQAGFSAADNFLKLAECNDVAGRRHRKRYYRTINTPMPYAIRFSSVRRIFSAFPPAVFVVINGARHAFICDGAWCLIFFFFYYSGQTIKANDHRRHTTTLRQVLWTRTVSFYPLTKVVV